MTGRAICVFLIVSLAGSAAQERPLPDADAFFAAARENLARAGREQARFAYKERRTELHMNPFGRMGTGGVRINQVTPGEEPGVTHRRLLERDGKPVPDAKTERVERRRRPEGRSSIEDAASVLTFKMDRRERIDGRDVIVVRFAPKPDAKPQTREGRLATVLKGTIWVDEVTHEVMRAEATATDDVSYGFGMIARLNKGATMELTREPVAGGVWLPTSLRFSGEGRALLVRKVTVNHVIEWFDYQLAGSR